MKAADSCLAYLDVVIPWQEVEEVVGGAQCLALCQPLLVEVSCKWLCNVLSTAAHVLLGKIYNNYMVDVAVRCTSCFLFLQLKQ